MKKMKNAGFSLVELIVVIAIMAILVGVAVPVYTSYIEKTQKAKDVQMTEEIAHAMEIAAIADGWANTYGITQDGTYIGAVILHPDKASAELEGATATDSALQEVYDNLAAELEDALITTFGEDYAEKLTLSYDGWVGTLNEDNIDVILGSSYIEYVPRLMGDIQNLTNSLQDFIDNGKESVVLGTGFYSWLTKNGIDINNTQATANAATLYVAQTMGKISASSEVKNNFIRLWTENNVGQLKLAKGAGTVGGDANLFTMVAAEYARAEAIVNYLNCQGARDAFVKDPVTGTTVDEVYASINVVTGNVVSHMNDGDGCANCKARYVAYFADEQAETDALAYFALLEQVEESQDVVFSNIGSSDLYSKSLMSFVNNYAAAANAMQTSQDGDVIIVFSLDANGALRANAYPIDYLG